MKPTRILPWITASLVAITGAVLVSNVCVHLDSFDGARRGCWKPAFWGTVPPWQGYLLWMVVGATVGYIVGWAIARAWRALVK